MLLDHDEVFCVDDKCQRFVGDIASIFSVRVRVQ
jgi:hypothetical protein